MYSVNVLHIFASFSHVVVGEGVSFSLHFPSSGMHFVVAMSVCECEFVEERMAFPCDLLFMEIYGALAVASIAHAE